MSTETISIKENVYNILVGLKRKNESFSNLLLRLAEKEKSTALVKNMTGTIDLGDTDTLIQQIRKWREDWHE